MFTVRNGSNSIVGSVDPARQQLVFKVLETSADALQQWQNSKLHFVAPQLVLQNNS